MGIKLKDMNTLNPMANLYMADPKEQKEPQQKHSREVQTTSVDIKYGIKAMRVLAASSMCLLE